MVLYFFPPVGGVSMSRNVRNVQYLPNHGWMPVVLTPRRAGYNLQDPGALDLVPEGTRVVRTGSLEAGHVRPLVVGVLQALGIRRRPARRITTPTVDDRAETHRPSDRSVPSRSRIEQIRRMLFFPDDEVGWLPFALFAALRAHRATPFDAIYSTSSPVTAHLIAAILKRWTGLPWIAEFRDPWLGNALAAPLPWFHRRLQVKLERWIVGSADRVIGVSTGITALYRARYPTAPEMTTITSGYDRSETRVLPRKPTSREKYRIVYTGTLDRPGELQIFLEGLDALLARRPELSDRLEVAFYGLVSGPCRAVANESSAGRNEQVVRFHGFVPRSQALDALGAADAALILLGPGPGMGLFIGGKLFDYIGQSVQILAMLPPGDSRDILASLDWGVICDPDPVDVARAIEQLLALPQPTRAADPAGLYDRAALAGRLAACLDDVAVAAAHRDEVASSKGRQ